MRIIGYARLSRATEESTSIVRQRAAIEDTARSRGWELVGIEEDNDVSATKSRLDRPGLNAVRDRIAAGAADAVLVWKLDRIARSVVDFGTLLDAGLQIVSCTEPLDTTTAMGRAMAEILQVFAAMEARTIGMRVSSSRRHLSSVGRYSGGTIPYGYRAAPHPDGVGRTLELDPAESAVVRECADRVLAGDSVYAVARSLAERGVPARRGGWTQTGLTNLLRGDAVLGRIRYEGKVVRGADGLPLVAYPPILTVGEHEQLLAMASAAGPRRRKGIRVLSGLAYCSSCGHLLHVRSAKTYATTYFCPARMNGHDCATPVSIKADDLDSHVEQWFLALFGDRPMLRGVETVQEDADVAAVELAIRETTDELREPTADVPALIERLTLLRTERDRLAALPTVATHTVVETGETYRAFWAGADTRARRETLLTAGVYAVVAPAAVRGRWDETRVSIELDLADELSLDPADPEVQSRGPRSV